MDNTIIYRQIGRDDYYKTWHKSEKNMLLFVHSGVGSFVSREKTYPISSGLLCFVGKDRYHYTLPEHIDVYERSKIFISSDMLSMLCRLLGSASEIFSERSLVFSELTDESALACESIFFELYECNKNDDLFGATLYSAMLRLMILLAKNVTDKTPKLSGVFEKTVDYINSHITEQISIEELYAVSFMSKYHFCRQFKLQTGLTVMEYILKTRIIMAKELLQERECTVSEISEMCGFGSISYFSRVFKASTGVTPTQYKKGMRKI